jgi:hypothetical protein
MFVRSSSACVISYTFVFIVQLSIVIQYEPINRLFSIVLLR